jgi:hypothetical protein
MRRAVFCLLCVVAAVATAAAPKYTEPQGHMLIFNGAPRSPLARRGAAQGE